jgi:hypothetical protein
LAKVAIGIGVARSSTKDDQRPPLTRLRRTAVESLQRGLDKPDMDPKSVCGENLNLRKISTCPEQLQRQIILNVTGREQKARYNHNAVRAERSFS